MIIIIILTSYKLGRKWSTHESFSACLQNAIRNLLNTNTDFALLLSFHFLSVIKFLRLIEEYHSFLPTTDSQWVTVLLLKANIHFIDIRQKTEKKKNKKQTNKQIKKMNHYYYESTKQSLNKCAFAIELVQKKKKRNNYHRRLCQ